MTDFVIIDSGTGGLPYFEGLKEKFPEASYVYVGDTANFPYGEKSHEQIVDCVIGLCKRIIAKFDPKIIVIACNTISVNVLDICREAFPQVLFVGTVPAIKIAGEISKKRKIGLLATSSTVKHPYNQDLLKHFASDCKLVLRADPELISFIEHKSFTATAEECEAACLPAVNFFRQEDCDVIILGCTHFLNLADIIQKVALPDIKVVDSKEGVVNRALSLYKGVAEMCSAGRGGEQRSASQGKAFPQLYITGFTTDKDQEEYNVVCKKFNVQFCGCL